MVAQADAQGSLPPCALRGPQRPPCGGIEWRIMRDWDAWSDGLEVVGASRGGGRAGRVAGCRRSHGRQLSVEWGGTRPVDLGQQETYSHSRPDSGEDGPAPREPCWSGENGLCRRIAWRGRSGVPASVWRSRSCGGLQPAVAWEQRPTGSPATATPGPVSTPVADSLSLQSLTEIHRQSQHCKM